MANAADRAIHLDWPNRNGLAFSLMKPSLPSFAEFRDTLSHAFENDFQTQVLKYLQHLYPSAQRVALKHGDGQMDIIQVNEGRVYACYAPIRYGEGWKEADVIAKIKKDLAGVKETLSTALKQWVFIHNFPSSSLTKKVATCMMKLRATNPDIKLFDPWGIDQLWNHLNDPNPEQRRKDYLAALVAAFSPYEELALDDYSRTEDETPNILDIFVHPACSEQHLRPEDIDADEQARLADPENFQPKHRTQDLIPLLAQPDYRRTVLLADPGMGKSTLIQSLIAHLASGQPIAEAPALTGLLPVPIILRDLVPLMSDKPVAEWTWEHLLDTLITRYCHREDTRPLFDAYRDHEQEFKDHLRSSASVFYLIDGLDEIGDLKQRKQLVHTIQEGIRTSSVEARWLITSRVIGYAECPVHLVVCEQFDSPVDTSSVWSDPNGFVSEVIDKIQSFRSNWSRWDIPHASGSSEITRGDVSDWMFSWSGLFAPNSTDSPPKPERRLVPQSWCNLTITRRLHLAPFDDHRQDRFTQRWFQQRKDQDYSRELLREIRHSNHDGVRIIGRVPNLLCMMNMLKRSGKPLPEGRYKLYAEITRHYLGGLDRVYFKHKNLGHHCPFSPDQLQCLLALIGMHMQQVRIHETGVLKSDSTTAPASGAIQDSAIKDQETSRLTIAREALHRLLLPLIEKWLPKSEDDKPRRAVALLDELLSHIAKRSGLLIPRGTDREGRELFAFTHLSFLEFYAACYLIQEIKHHDDLELARYRAERARRTFDEAAYLAQYPRGEIAFRPTDLESFAAQSLWHEVLIFLLEAHSHRDDHPQRDALLEYLFPALHCEEAAAESPSQVAAAQPDAVTLREPLVPIAAVELLVKLAWDKDLSVREEIRLGWWRKLWTARLRWPWHSWERDESRRWHIAPRLLEYDNGLEEVISALVEAWEPHLESSTDQDSFILDLRYCHTLTDKAFGLLSELRQLTELRLAGCALLTTLDPIQDFRSLRVLGLLDCSRIQGDRGFDALRSCSELQELVLVRCVGLISTDCIRGLDKLEIVDFSGCSGLKDRNSLLGLLGLKALTEVRFSNRTGLSENDIEWLRTRLAGKCRVIGP